MKTLTSVFLLLIFILSCRNEREGKKLIMVSILPQKYFAEKITGERFKVNVMVPPGANPENYEFTPADLKNAADAEIFFANGYIDFERVFVSKISSVNKNLKIIDLSKGAELIECIGEDKHEHHSGGVDPHTWLSTKEVKTQVKLILDAVIAADTAGRLTYLSNYNSFMQEIDSLDARIRSMLAGLTSRKFIIYHPSLSYFSRDYNLDQHSIEIEGKSPSPREIRQLIDVAKKEGIRKVFIQAQFDKHSAELISHEINGDVIHFDPLAYNWAENLLLLAELLTKPVTK